MPELKNTYPLRFGIFRQHAKSKNWISYCLTKEVKKLTSQDINIDILAKETNFVIQTIKSSKKTRWKWVIEEEKYLSNEDDVREYTVNDPRLKSKA